ncbi:hypothetical protein THAOC_32197 [Thalassiosira oceanica]|uniref:Uncharacterized protein n=1 Tax=Thalassiosira oceanica TaxID=159749 RepID=K0R9Q1_THAOC|nr:hypothetical protein THAOC_32197 [Thalassiosira oceanica]|eukprot:EJK48969.1 hypothetical protein THAOC_32197 [Thalassiosira oceanica]
MIAWSHSQSNSRQPGRVSALFGRRDGDDGGNLRRRRSKGDLQRSRSIIAWSHSSSNSRQPGRVSARTMLGTRGDDLARGTEWVLEPDRAGGLDSEDEDFSPEFVTRLELRMRQSTLSAMLDKGGPWRGEESRTTINCAACESVCRLAISSPSRAANPSGWGERTIGSRERKARTNERNRRIGVEDRIPLQSKSF